MLYYENISYSIRVDQDSVSTMKSFGHFGFACLV
jgi:hypothetical protein